MKLVVLFCYVTLNLVYSEKSSRIIGGTAAYVGQFPYVAAIYKTTADGTYFCSGTLLNNEWVLTAAQCVYNGISFQIRLGSNTLQSNDSNRIIVAAATYYHHKDFDVNTLRNDIALIRFYMPITFSDYIKPIDYLDRVNLDEGRRVVTLGWGQTSDSASGLSNVLNYVALSTLSNIDCSFFFGNQLADHMVCAVGNYNEGVCTGDSGSPLILYGTGSSVYLVGVSSFNSGNGCESTDPSGFTRVVDYVDWIINITANG